MPDEPAITIDTLMGAFDAIRNMPYRYCPHIISSKVLKHGGYTQCANCYRMIYVEPPTR